MGATSDIIMIPLILGVVMVPVYVSFIILDAFQAAETEYTIDNDRINDGITALRVFDYMIIFIVASVAIGSIILAASLKTHPAFSVISILILIVMVSIAAFIANVFYEIQNAPGFANAANVMDNFVKLNNNLPLITAVLGSIIILALYAKPWESRAGPTF